MEIVPTFTNQDLQEIGHKILPIYEVTQHFSSLMTSIVILL